MPRPAFQTRADFVPDFLGGSKLKNSPLPIARATSQMISQSGFDSPGGSIALRTRCTRRSEFMKVPSFSNDEPRAERRGRIRARFRS